MKCDDYLVSIESGGLLRRALARLHAARCEQCATARERWLETRRQWVDPPVVTAAQRELWARAATSERKAVSASARPAPRWANQPARRWAFAVAAGLLVVLYVGVSVWRGLPGAVDVAPAPAPALAAADPVPAQTSHASPFEALERALDQLSIELNELEQEAAFMDARQDVDQL